MNSGLTALIVVHISYIVATIAMGLLMRLAANPEEVASIKRRIEDISSRIPPKHARTSPKLIRKARLLENELSRLRKRYTIINLKRLTAVFIAYGIGLFIVMYKLPYLFESPAHIPLLTFKLHGKYFIPSTYIFLMGILLASPIALKISEYTRE